MRSPGGYAVILDPGADRALLEMDTFTCCHCNRVCHVRPGSGVKRGYCFMCGAPHCGGKNCWECVPFERKLEAWESRGRFQRMMERL